MSTDRIEAQIADLLTPMISGAGLELDAVRLLKQGKTTLVRITVEEPEGQPRIGSEQLAYISREISAAMDSADPIETEYLLEISTPGAERELLKPAHWRRQIGGLAHVKTRDGHTLDGRVLSVEADGVTVEINGENQTITYDEMKKARARVDFGFGE